MYSIPQALVALDTALKGKPKQQLEVPTKPIPASRPRVSKWGTYYGKNYTTFRKEAERLLQEAEGQTSAPLAVIMVIAIEKPKTSKRLFPRGDNDNYEKAVWDSVTKCPGAWDDDDQIVFNATWKRFTTEGEEPGIYLTIYELEE